MFIVTKCICELSASKSIKQILADRGSRREEFEPSRPALILPFISLSHSPAVTAGTIASSGLTCEIRPVSSVMKRPVRI